MTTGDQPTSHKPKKGRSPSYPNISLDVAVKRAAKLYEAEGRNIAPIAAIQQHWGYNINSGPANLAVAALKKYGLLEDSGSGKERTARLTDLGYEVVHHPDPVQRAAAIRRAALLPSIHSSLWEMYRETGLPSDATLRHELVFNRAFTETGATEFMTQFRKTVAYANLGSTATVDPSGEDGEPDETPGDGSNENRQQGPDGSSDVRRKRRESEPGMLTLNIPLVGTAKPLAIEGQFPISEAAWTQLQDFLNVLKPSLVSDDPEA